MKTVKKVVVIIVMASLLLCACKNNLNEELTENQTTKLEETSENKALEPTQEASQPEEISVPVVSSAEPVIPSLSSEETISELFAELGVNVKTGVCEYRYVFSDGSAIEGELFNTASVFLAGYLGSIDIRETSTESEEAEAIIFDLSGSYEVHLSETEAAVYVKSGSGAGLVKTYTYAGENLSLAKLRGITFRSTQMAEYVQKASATELSVTGLVETNRLYFTDLDGDGKSEELFVGFAGTDWDMSWGEMPDIVFDADYTAGECIYVNGDLKASREYASFPCSDYFALIQMGTDNKAMYIVTYDDGPSNDPQSFLYRCDGGEAVLTCTIPDCLFSLDVLEGVNEEKVKADRIDSESVTAFVQMWTKRATYTVDENGNLLETVVEYEPYVNEPIELLYSVEAYSDKDDLSERVTVEAGKVYIDDTDGEAWIHLSTDGDKTGGWINIDSLSGVLSDEDKAKVESYRDLFEGLYVAG